MLRELSPRANELHQRLVAFTDQWVYPNETDQSAMEFRRKADDYDRSLRGMRRLHDRLGAGR